MSATLTNRATGAVVTATDAVAYESTRPGLAREHAVLGRPVPEFTLAAGAPARGTIELLFSSRAQAHTAELLLSAAGPFTVTAAALVRTFLVTGAVTLTYVGGHSALVTVAYTEVAS